MRSAPGVARWLGDIRRFFPSGVVRVIQRDAIERLELRQLLLEPEVLDSVEADIHLVATLLELARLLPETSRHTARQLVGRVVAEIEARLASPTRQAARGALARAARIQRPRPPTSTGTARSGPTCATTSPSWARSCPSG